MEYKSLIAKLAIIFILTLSFVNSYSKTSSLVYADSTTDQWTSVTTNQELADAFRYYCKSRNLAIEGSVLDALTTFTTDRYNQICNTLGIDITALQAHLKRSTDSNGKLQFLFDESGITAYNRIFAEFLQNNNLEVGDQVDNQELYSGQFFVDKDGHGCLIFKYSSSSNVDDGIYSAKGTPYRVDAQDLMNLTDSNSGHYSVVCHLSSVTNWTLNSYKSGPFNSGNYTYELVYNTESSAGYGFRWCETSYRKGYPNNDRVEYKGYPIIFLNTSNGNYYVGAFVQDMYGKTKKYGTTFAQITFDANYQPTNTVIFITTNNNTINNNTYNDNKQTVINNDGDVYNYDYDNEDPPINDPSGGGGTGGGDGGDTTNVDIDFPNFNFNIPDIDFSLKGLTDKFPFCIPFDMVALLQLLNAEPQAPRIQGQIPFGSFYTWNLDLDFSRFDDFATIMRGLEFVGFIFFLISATINIAKG